MEREHQPILIVHESWIDFVLHVRRLAVELRPQVRNLHRLAILIFSFKRHLSRFRLPFPRMSQLKVERRQIYAPGVADPFNLPPRIDTKGLRHLFDNWWTRLRP